MNLRVDFEGDIVSDPIDCAAEEVKARAEVGYGGGGEGLYGGVNGFRFKICSDRQIAAERRWEMKLGFV